MLAWERRTGYLDTINRVIFAGILIALTHFLSQVTAAQEVVPLYLRAPDSEPASARHIADLDGDGSVTHLDLAALIHLVSDGHAARGFAGDLNGDGKVDAEDVRVMVELLSGRGSSDCPGMWFCCQYNPPYGCCGDEICNESSNDDDLEGIGGPGDLEAGGGGGGGGGVIIPNCDDCDDFVVTGPSYAAAGDSVWAWGGWPGNIGCNLLPLTVDVISGQHLLTSGKAGDAPGTVRLRVTRTLPDGMVCERIHSVQIVRYSPVRLRYATYIECPLIANPFGPLSSIDFFGGDDRGPDPLSQSYRSAHERLIAPHLFVNTGPEVFPYNLTPHVVAGTIYPFGASTGYSAASAVGGFPAPCTHALIPGAGAVAQQTLQVSVASVSSFTGTVDAFLTDFGGGTIPGNFALAVRRTSPRHLRVYLWVNGANPLVPAGPAITGFVRCDLAFAIN